MAIAAIRFDFTLQDKTAFFDRPKAIAALSKAENAFLAGSGAYVRKVAMRSLKRVGKKGNPSRPGTPPKHHQTGDAEALRKIEFRLAKDAKRVEVGPVYLPRTRKNPTTPALHEFGGTAGLFEWRLGPGPKTKWIFDPENVAKYADLSRSIKKWKSYSKRNPAGSAKFRSGKKKRMNLEDFDLQVTRRQASYPARPFMRPALSKSTPKINEILEKEIDKTLRKKNDWLKK